MRLFQDIPLNRDLFTHPVLTIGNFDGVHTGHHRILSTLLNIAREKSGEAVVITFSSHPRKILTPKTPPRILTTAAEKTAAMQAYGIGTIIMLDFTPEMAQMEALDFINEIVLKRLGAIDIIVGYDHAFGKNRSGTFPLLLELSKKRGFHVTRVEPKNFYSRPVSSTWIRAEIEDGTIGLANTLLGRRYALSGRIVHGDRRGTGIGFPTANVVPDDPDKVLPKDGVYAVMVIIDGKRYRGMLNIGTNPTFAKTERTIEVNIFDFNRDLYGTEITIEFIDRLRDEIKFASADDLVRQLNNDKIAADEILRAGDPGWRNG